jgi:hypothetical protein
VVLVFGTAVYKNLIELPIGFFRHKEDISSEPYESVDSPDEVSTLERPREI